MQKREMEAGNLQMEEQQLMPRRGHTVLQRLFLLNQRHLFVTRWMVRQNLKAMQLQQYQQVNSQVTVHSTKKYQDSYLSTRVTEDFFLL
jgi:hypothetical protein